MSDTNQVIEVKLKQFIFGLICPRYAFSVGMIDMCMKHPYQILLMLQMFLHL